MDAKTKNIGVVLGVIVIVKRCFIGASCIYALHRTICRCIWPDMHQTCVLKYVLPGFYEPNAAQDAAPETKIYSHAFCYLLNMLKRPTERGANNRVRWFLFRIVLFTNVDNAKRQRIDGICRFDFFLSTAIEFNRLCSLNCVWFVVTSEE